MRVRMTPFSGGTGVFIAYDHNRHGETQILMAVFAEDDVRAGEIRSQAGRLRVVIDHLK